MLMTSRTPSMVRRVAGPGLRRTTRTIVRASGESGAINKDIQKEKQKVVDTLSIKDVDVKCVMCRCWRSSTFPKCDGSHVAHNKATGDNVGPLIISPE